jgi:hypothetical protein
MYLCRRVNRRRSFRTSTGSATYIECLGGPHFPVALFRAVFVGFMDMLSIAIEAVVEFHVALRQGVHDERGQWQTQLRHSVEGIKRYA